MTARSVQMLGAAINAFSQGVAYYHAGFDILRSKSLDRNSFNSGDWFNRLDWSYQRQLLRHRPAAGGRQRQGLRADQAAAAQRRDQAGAGRHRLRARRLPRPAGDPRQLTLFRLRTAQGHRAAPALLQHRAVAGTDRDRRPPGRRPAEPSPFHHAAQSFL
jgi:pullulanase